MGDVMQGFDLALTGDVDKMFSRLGVLPDAPLVMPKQRLEATSSDGGLIARLFGRPRLGSSDLRRSGS